MNQSNRLQPSPEPERSRNEQSESELPGSIHALKLLYLESLAALGLQARTLREVVLSLIQRGLRRTDLVRWAVEAGYSETYVSGLLNKILRDAGCRRRRTGAGRRTPPEALQLKAEACQRFGSKAGKFLLAAYRAWQRENPRQTPPDTVRAQAHALELSALNYHTLSHNDSISVTHKD